MRRVGASCIRLPAYRRLGQQQTADPKGELGPANAVREDDRFGGGKANYSISTNLPREVPITEAEVRALEILLGSDLGAIWKIDR